MNIVLAHGFLGFEKILGIIEYFKGVRKHLEDTFGARVVVPKVAKIASIAARGTQLREQILKAFGDGSFDPGEKAHIIAHSMGGLDARFVISDKDNSIADRIASLTTVGTPHRGVPVADLIARALNGEQLSGAESIVASLLREAIESQALLDAVDDADKALRDAVRDLSTKGTDEFNKSHPNHPQVRYFSIAGKGREGFLKPKTSAFFLLPYKHTKRAAGDNDGLIPVTSATLIDGEVDIWPTDHADEIGHNLNLLPPDSGFDHLPAYKQIVERATG